MRLCVVAKLSKGFSLMIEAECWKNRRHTICPSPYAII